MNDNLENLDPEKLLPELKTSLDGLSESEVTNRLNKYGKNILKNEGHKSLLNLLANQFKSSLVYLLLVASILSFALNNFNDGLIIAVILLINTALGFYQEFHSEKAVEKLQKLVSKEILVLRNSKEVLVSERLIVLGDILILREGDIVPADVKLYEVNDLNVDE